MTVLWEHLIYEDGFVDVHVSPISALQS